MNQSQKAKLILKILNKIYPSTPIPLKHNSKFTLLVSVLLSAQCTDVNVNNVTKSIYPKYNQPKHFVKLGWAYDNTCVERSDRCPPTTTTNLKSVPTPGEI